MDRKDLHAMIGEAIRCARQGNDRSVLNLSEVYSGVSTKVYSNPLSELDLLYDKCMEGCALAANLEWAEWKARREELLDEVESIYRGLEVPED